MQKMCWYLFSSSLVLLSCNNGYSPPPFEKEIQYEIDSNDCGTNIDPALTKKYKQRLLSANKIKFTNIEADNALLIIDNFNNSGGIIKKVHVDTLFVLIPVYNKNIPIENNECGAQAELKYPSTNDVFIAFYVYDSIPSIEAMDTLDIFRCTIFQIKQK